MLLEGRSGARRGLRALLCACMMLVCCGLSGAALPGAAHAQDGHMTIAPAELSASRQVTLGFGKSLIVDLPRDAKDVLVSDPGIADAVMRTARRAYLIGVEVGQTNVFFFDHAGRQIAVLEVQVERDLTLLSQSLRQLLPGSDVRVQSLNDNILLTGTVRTPADAVNAAGIAARFVGDPDRVMNMISSHGSEQVHLKVTVAEMRRNTLKQFGVDLNALVKQGTQLAVITQNPFALGTPISDTAATASFGNLATGDRLSATVRAMEQNGVIRVLAEPTLSAISGESAEFLAGGEFPVPIGYDPNTQVATIEYKRFGVSLAFTPVVHTGGRIALKVKTEVSELTSESAVTVGPLTVPGLNTRQAETTIELPSGGSLVLAGLIKQDTKHVINGIPGLKNIPVLGALFRSRDYINNETELVVIATPYLVQPAHPGALSRPDENFAPATDPGAILLGRVNRVSGATPRGGVRGRAGFIID